MQRPEIKNNIQQSNGTHGITNYSNTKYGDTKYHNAKYHNLKNYNAEYSSMKQKDIPRSYTQEHTLKSSAIATMDTALWNFLSCMFCLPGKYRYPKIPHHYNAG